MKTDIERLMDQIELLEMEVALGRHLLAVYTHPTPNYADWAKAARSYDQFIVRHYGTLPVEEGEHVHDWVVYCRRCTETPNVKDHYVTFRDDGWFVEHSLECRLNGEMQDGCVFQEAVENVDGREARELVGRWRITGIDEDFLPDLEQASVTEETQ